MIITTDQLSQGLKIQLSKAKNFVDHINNATSEYGIISNIEVASFLAQVGHETALLSTFEENLNYSANGLAKTWPNRYAKPDGTPNVLALSLHRKPQAIANNVYANRYGNGNEASGDGWKFHGRGGIQLTFKNSYKKCGDDLGIDLINHPSLLVQPHWSMMSAGWYWKENRLNRFDDDLSVTAETRIINGGTIGLQNRQRLFNQLVEVLK